MPVFYSAFSGHCGTSQTFVSSSNCHPPQPPPPPQICESLELWPAWRFDLWRSVRCKVWSSSIFCMKYSSDKFKLYPRLPADSSHCSHWLFSSHLSLSKKKTFRELIPTFPTYLVWRISRFLNNGANFIIGIRLDVVQVHISFSLIHLIRLGLSWPHRGSIVPPSHMDRWQQSIFGGMLRSVYMKFRCAILMEGTMHYWLSEFCVNNGFVWWWVSTTGHH